MARGIWVVAALACVMAPAGAEASDGSRVSAQLPEPAALTAGEREDLARRARISRPLRFRLGASGEYLGGLSYQVVRATPATILRSLADPAALEQMLPATESATLLSSGGHRARFELVQGRSPFKVKYTINVEQAPSGDRIRFWLDPTRPHGIRDIWGFFKATPFDRGRSLVTVAVVVDLGPGLARTFFSDRVERVILRTPTKIRDFVEPQALALLR